jgi:CBS domain-containing protein
LIHCPKAVAPASWTHQEVAMPTLTAKDVMNTEVLTVRVDLTVRELAAFLIEHQISGAPVVDEGGRLVGLVSVTDVAQNDAERPDLVDDRSSPAVAMRGWEERMNPEDIRPLHIESDDLLVRDIMTPTVYTVPEDTPVAKIARTMVAGRIHRLLVTRGGRVVGIVTSLDLVGLLAGKRPRRDTAAARATTRIKAGRVSAL